MSFDAASVDETYAKRSPPRPSIASSHHRAKITEAIQDPTKNDIHPNVIAELDVDTLIAEDAKLVGTKTTVSTTIVVLVSENEVEEEDEDEDEDDEEDEEVDSDD